MIRIPLLNARTGSAVGAFLLLVALSGSAENIDTPYDFPIKPGTPAWKALDNHIEKINASQIPEFILQLMNTEALIKTCLNYPLYLDMFAFDYKQTGFQLVASSFNGLRELLERKDIGRKILPIYEAMGDSVERARRHMYIEMLLAQPEVISALDSDGKIRLLRENMKKFSAKRSRPDIFSNYTLIPVCLVMGRVIKNLIDQGVLPGITLSEESVKFIENPSVATGSVIEDIATTAEKILKKHGLR
jgi:hypothetical protein